jgi:hypothetical protein
MVITIFFTFSPKNQKKIHNTHELAASLKPFSIAGTKPDGIFCPTIMLSNSNLVDDPIGSGSTYLEAKENSNANVRYYFKASSTGP